jgi:hypothetical protein
MMSAHGTNRLTAQGQGTSALPLNSDVYLFRYAERVVL